MSRLSNQGSWLPWGSSDAPAEGASRSRTDLVVLWLAWSRARAGDGGDGDEAGGDSADRGGEGRDTGVKDGDTRDNFENDDAEGDAGDVNAEGDAGDANTEGDEVDDHVAKKSSWSFWTPGKPEGKEGEPTNGAAAAAAASNTILDSLHSPDDAVLYKPHSDARAFSEINTHKNENLRENVIVPSWELCLPHQTSLAPLLAGLFGGGSTANGSQRVDQSNWGHFLSRVLAKLGFSLPSLSDAVAGEGPEGVSDTVERELSLLYEKTYQLYGRSLAKLPPHKRACLPSYEQCYDAGPAAEEDGDISISNDPMGNLLIHQRPRETGARAHACKAGPLVKIRKTLIIGVHGFFPTKMVRPFIGLPKGTLLKFAAEAEKAVIRYCVEAGLLLRESLSVSIRKIALEMEGKIMDRVEFFTTILARWEAELNEADFIFVASHLQGCVVSIILLARLMQRGILRDPIRKRIGVLGMAGVNNGPFYGVDKLLLMKAYLAIENELMLELFELTKFGSPQLLAFKELMQCIINANVKLCLIGSINDQLVPLYLALASHTFHPNIYRACYIDHALQLPRFVQKLVLLCCQMQNLGFFDNNVIKELSTALAGPLTGGGHSKIYNDGKVYDLGIKFVLDTDDIVIPPGGEGRQDARPVGVAAEAPSGTAGSPSGPAGAAPGAAPAVGLVTSGIGTYGPLDHAVLPPTNQIYIKEYNVGKIGTNPFILPWCFRGLLFNIEKNWPNNNKLLTVESGSALGKNGYDEIAELQRLFEEWRPETKLYKELKYRLNGLRASKL
jgi:hypothetical protein